MPYTPDPISPFRIEFDKNSVADFPIPSPGSLYDGQAGEDDSGLYPVSAQVTTITLGGSSALDDVTTLTITPLTMQNGSAWAAEVAPVVLTYKDPGTATLAGVTAGIEAAAAAAVLVTDLADIDNYQKVLDLVKVTSTATEIILTGAYTGVTFTYTLSSPDVTEAGVTTGSGNDPLELGLMIVQDGAEANGRKFVKLPDAASVSADILGASKHSIHVEPSQRGDTTHYYHRGNDVVWRKYGSFAAYGETVCALDGQVYGRVIAAAPLTTIGALTDTPVNSTQEVITVTPTAVNDTLYGARLTVTDMHTGVVAADGFISMTSDASATATEIVTGLVASLALNAGLSALVTPTGTATLILTQDAGYRLTFEQTEVGVLDDVLTDAAVTEHLLWPGAKFLRTTTKAGPQAIFIDHP